MVACHLVSIPCNSHKINKNLFKFARQFPIWIMEVDDNRLVSGGFSSG